MNLILGLNNRIETTRTRTLDGKFYTTICTKNSSNEDQFSSSTDSPIHRLKLEKKSISNEDYHLFGQPMKRTHSSESNSLNSLTKKVLQMENDRINSQMN